MDVRRKLVYRGTHKKLYWVSELSNKRLSSSSRFCSHSLFLCDRFQDAFKEKAGSGINIFRFKERLHQFHGTVLSSPPPPAMFDLSSLQPSIINRTYVQTLCPLLDNFMLGNPVFGALAEVLPRRPLTSQIVVRGFPSVSHRVSL